MPYTHDNTDERNALQAMEGMGLPTSYQAVHLSSVYRELNQNSAGGVYTGNEAQQASAQRRLEAKPRSQLEDPGLIREIMGLFKQDLSPDQISGRLGVLYPEQPEKQASPSTIYAGIYRETAKAPALKAHFRQKQAKPWKRVKDHWGHKAHPLSSRHAATQPGSLRGTKRRSNPDEQPLHRIASPRSP